MTENSARDYVSRDRLEQPGQLLGEVGYKPYVPAIVVAVSGLIILAWSRSLFGVVICALFLLFAGVVLLGVKDHKVLEVYENAMYLVDVKDANRVMVMPYDQIQSYCVNKNNNNVIVFTTVDGESFQTMSFQRGKADRLLRKVLRGKSEEEHKLEQLKNMKASGFSALKRFRK